MTHLKIVADENVAYRVIKALRIKGFEVISISEDNPSITDDNVLQYAYEQKAILLTEDSDFGELIFRKKAPHVGVLYVRLAGVAIDEKIELIVYILENKADELINSFCRLNKNGFKIIQQRPNDLDLI